MRAIQTIEWQAVGENLNDRGFAQIPSLLTEKECDYFVSRYNEEKIYRNTIDMQRYRFGRGEYKYFAYPLPDLLQTLRTNLYSQLVPIANAWMRVLSKDLIYPESHTDLQMQCHNAGQRRPTPLILKYIAGGFNTLHQDLYGEIYFPFQVVIMLMQRGKDYEGGEFVMTEQVPRAQSIAHVINAKQGDAIVFTTNFRPVRGSRGYYRATMKHGISEVTSGERYALGVIFHDAK
jgi:hypothetical protein